MAQYKAMITKWFMGTGGGDGRSTFFENWDEAKLDKYAIDPEEYDHTNMAERPSILIENYHNHRNPYLTMIYLWDEKVDFLLSSRYDPLTAGTGEAGMRIDDDESISELSTTASSAKKRSPRKVKRNGKKDDGGINESMLAIVNLLKSSSDNKKPPPAAAESTLSLTDLNVLYDKHVSHMSFLKDNDLLTEEKKQVILKNIEEVYGMITNTHSNNKRNREEDSYAEVVVHNSNSKVS